MHFEMKTIILDVGIMLDSNNSYKDKRIKVRRESK